MNRDTERSPQPGSNPHDSQHPSPQPSSQSDEPSFYSPAERLTLERQSGLDRIRALSHLLDNAIPIPGTDYSFGLDPIIGLLPAGGDVVGTVLSAYIVLEATRFRLTVPTLSRMFFNILLDMVVGTIPFIGDLFDMGWKANAKNLRLIEAHLQHPEASQSADRKFFVILVLAFIVIIAVQIAWYVVVFQLVASLFAS